jgi:hypothetical protein
MNIKIATINGVDPRSVERTKLVGSWLRRRSLAKRHAKSRQKKAYKKQNAPHKNLQKVA